MGFFDELINKVSSGVHNLFNPSDPVKNPIYNMQDFASPEAAPSGQLKRPENVDNFVDNMARNVQQIPQQYNQVVQNNVLPAVKTFNDQAQGFLDTAFAKPPDIVDKALPFYSIARPVIKGFLSDAVKNATVGTEDQKLAAQYPDFILHPEKIKENPELYKKVSDANLRNNMDLVMGLTGAPEIKKSGDILKEVGGKAGAQFEKALADLGTSANTDSLIQGIDDAVRNVVAQAGENVPFLSGIKKTLEERVQTVSNESVKRAILDQIGVLDDITKQASKTVAHAATGSLPLVADTRLPNINTSAGDTALPSDVLATKPLPSGVSDTVTRTPSTTYSPTASIEDIKNSPTFQAKYKSTTEEKPFLDSLLSDLSGDRQFKTATKDITTTAEKIVRKLPSKPEYSENVIGDMLRGNIIAKDAADAQSLLQSLGQKVKVENVENYVNQPTVWGYQGININIRTPNGNLAEVQIHTPESIAVQKALHPLYEKWRNESVIPKEVFDQSKAVADFARKEFYKNTKIESTVTDLFTSLSKTEEFKNNYLLSGRDPNRAFARTLQQQIDEGKISNDVLNTLWHNTPVVTDMETATKIAAENTGFRGGHIAELLDRFNTDAQTLADDSIKKINKELPLVDSSRLPGGDGTPSPFPAGSGTVPPPPGGGAGATDTGSMPNIVIDEAGKLRKLDEPNKYQFDLKQLNTPDDVKNTILEMAKTSNPEIQTARRGTISWEQTRKFADALGMTTEEVMSRKPGKMYNAEELDAATRLALGAADNLTQIQQKVRALKEAGQEIPSDLRSQLVEATMQLKGIQASVIGARSEAGRVLNAVKMMKDAVTVTEKTKAEQVIKKIFAGDEKTAEKMIDKLSDFAPDDTLGMVKFINQVKPSTPIDKIEELWYNSILSNTATHIVNFTGNTMSTLLRFPEKAVSSVIDSVLTTGGKAIGKNVQKERYMAEVGAELSGVRGGFTKGIERAMYVMKNGLSAQDVNKFDIGRGQAIKGPIGDVVNIPSRALVASDELFKGINFEMGLWEQATRMAKQEGLKGAELTARVADIVSSPDPKVVSAAMDKAKNRLFQDNSASANAVRAFRDNMAVVNLGKLGEFKPVRFIIPFITTPLNVLKYGLERSPAGLAAIPFQIASGAGKGEVSDQLAKAFIGSAMMVPLAMHFSEDKITGAPPSDPKEKDAFYADGKLPYSVKIGDRWVSYNRVEPFNTILSQIAMWHDSFKNNDQIVSQETISEFLRGTVMNLADQTFMTGMGNLVNAVEDPERYGQKFITDILGGFIPSLAAAGARTVDPTIRKPESVVQDLQARIPFLSKGVPARESDFEANGQAVRKGGLATQIINNFTGFRTSPASNTDILGTVREIKQLNKDARAGSEQEKADALKMLDEIQKTPKAERGALLKDWADSGRLSDKAVTVIQNAIQERALPLKGEEDYLKNSPIKTRAKYIYDQLSKVPPGERADYITRLTERKILTNDVADALVEYVTSQQQGKNRDLPLYNR